MNVRQHRAEGISSGKKEEEEEGDGPPVLLTSCFVKAGHTQKVRNKKVPEGKKVFF